MDKIYRRATQTSGTPKKKKDEKARKRNVIMNFRVSPVEKELIELRIRMSGLPKAEFFIQSCLYQTVLVKGNIRTFDELRRRMDALEIRLSELAKEEKLYEDEAGKCDARISDDKEADYHLESARMILEILEGSNRRRNRYVDEHQCTD